jgi:hypothetical protein
LRPFALGKAACLAAVGLIACLWVTVPPLAAARPRARVPHISSVRCWPARVCGQNPHAISTGGTLRFKGRNLKSGMLVLFPGRSKPKVGRYTVAPHLRKANGFLTTVPSWARSGRVRVVGKRARSNAAGPITITRPPKLPSASGEGPFDGSGMWIWYVKRSSGGAPTAIAEKAKSYGVRTVFVKSSDGTSWWSQFSPELVSALKAGGLRVCAWEFVYGSHPSAEAALGGRAAQTGADCLVIDAESAYEGRYAQAQDYVRTLRSQVGAGYPLALAGFPYVDYHPAFPYSVFFGPGGAQASLPQLYWKAIGVTVDQAFRHTYTWNQVYGRPISPLGQLYGDPSPGEIQRFRQLAGAHGATGLSWWSWQSASPRGWDAIAKPLAPLAGPPAPTTYPTLKRGSRGDVVVWAQEHLLAAGQTVSADGLYGSAMEQVVRDFQMARALPATGQVDVPTWTELLRYQPAMPDWAKVARASAAEVNGRNGPQSARLRERQDELRGARPLFAGPR